MCKVSSCIFLGVTILQGVEFPIFLLLFEWALQQCSATALPVMSFRDGRLDKNCGCEAAPLVIAGFRRVTSHVATGAIGSVSCSVLKERKRILFWFTSVMTVKMVAHELAESYIP